MLAKVKMLSLSALRAHLPLLQSSAAALFPPPACCLASRRLAWCFPQARHSHIVALHGLCVTADLSLALVMELLDRSLFDVLHPGGAYDSQLATPLPLSIVVSIARGLRNALNSHRPHLSPAASPAASHAEPSSQPPPSPRPLPTGMASGLAFLHDTLRVAHRDIKSLNILLTKEMVPKISDFGLSREVQPLQSVT